MTKNLLKRNGNKQVQLFDLGLDFSDSRTSARLRRGSYVVVQVPGENMWRWDDWRYDADRQTLVDADGELAPHNVIIFAVAQSHADNASSGIRKPGEKALKSAVASV